MEPRTHLNEELGRLHERILKMGALVEEALRKAVRALATDDEALAQEVIRGDEEVDNLHHDLEDFATRIIALEQPVATDLRELITSTKLAGGLERIGDHARHIAKITNTLPQPVLSATLPSIERMSEIGIGMVHDSLTAFVDEDVNRAREVAERDDEIDAEHRQLYQNVVAMMKEHPEWITHGVDLMFLNRYLERLGDHVTNMCEWVVFAKTGLHLELNK
jgi:phosphate transport system protein